MATDRNARLWERLGAGSGTLFVVLILPGIILSAASGDPTRPASEIARQGAGGYTEILVGIYLTLVGVFFFLSFVAYLHHYLREPKAQKAGWRASPTVEGWWPQESC